jgi:hypothetical protein
MQKNTIHPHHTQQQNIAHQRHQRIQSQFKEQKTKENARENCQSLLHTQMQKAYYRTQKVNQS